MFYYYGAKARSAGRYPAPTYDTIVEPFAGAGGYSVHHLYRKNVDKVILVEKDPRVVEVWTRLLSMTPEEVMRIPVPDVGSRTDDFFIMCSSASNAMAKSKTYKVTQRSVNVFETMKRRVAKHLPAMSGRTEIVHDDYRNAPNLRATWFIDPPYQVVKRDVKTAHPQGMGYASGCDSASINYVELATWVCGRRGQSIVCEMDGADWLDFSPLYETANTLGLGHREAVWVGDN